MTMQPERQTRDAAVAVQPPQDGSSRLNQLIDRQSETVASLAGLEVERARLQEAIPRLEGSDQRAATVQLENLTTTLAETRARLAETRRNLADLRGAPAPGELISTTGIPRSEMMFGMTRSEFQGAGALLLMVPIVIACAWHIWVRASRQSGTRDVIPLDRFDRLDRAIESVAVEVERIGESQRFTTRLLTEQQAQVPVATLEALPRPVITPRP